MLRFGPGVCGQLDEAQRREWLVTDGVGGYAMGTVAGLRTRRYHGLLVVADAPGLGRHLGLVGLDPVLVLGDRRVRLGTWEWDGGVVDPAGLVYLAGFELVDGTPTWRWQVDDVVVESSVAMARGRPAVGVTYRLLSGAPVNLEIGAMNTWRDVNGTRTAGSAPVVTTVDGGFVFESSYRVKGPGFTPTGQWYRGVRAREEAARGLDDIEDVWFAGRFCADLAPGGVVGVTAWAAPMDDPGPANQLVATARQRWRALGRHAGDDTERLLVRAADQFIVDPPGGNGPAVVAGYPWFGAWTRDTMTSYEGLFLATGRGDEGRRLLEAAADTVSAGMLANICDGASLAYNSADATLWFLHALDRHVTVTGDTDLVAKVADCLSAIVDHHVAGTRIGIGVDPGDGLLTQGADGWALTWMDAQVDGRPVTPRTGKAVEINGLWLNGLGAIARMLALIGRPTATVDALFARGSTSFVRRFVRPDGGGLFDVVDGPSGDDNSVRPNQLIAAALPHGPLATQPAMLGQVVRACRPLLTPLGLRSLDPADPAYQPLHRGGPAERDRAYHQGTVWPWLLGPYLDTVRRAGMEAGAMLGAVGDHLGEWGLGSVSETADGAAPHAATGCPFQAWSVAEWLRAYRAA